ncbi:hypothetical protein LCGC14_2791400, partial [marine sediment metagenome]
FEPGDASLWDGGETDTGSLLDFPHYTTLAAIPGSGLPFRGAYCMRVVCGDANPHTVDEGSIDIADDATAFVRFYLYIDNGFAATANDTFNIFEFQQAGGTIEASLSLKITATTDVVAISLGDGIVSSETFFEISKGVWHAIEMKMRADLLDLGTLDLWVDGANLISITGLDNAAAVGLGVLGTQDTAATTTGTLLFDQFVFDDLQIYPFKRRYVENVLVTKNQHVFVGNGRIENVTLLSGDMTADNVLQIYDTDDADTDDASNIVAELRNTAANETVDPAGMPVRDSRGAYITLTGTSTGRGPRALVQIGAAQGWGSDGAIRNYAAKRTS